MKRLLLILSLLSLTGQTVYTKESMTFAAGKVWETSADQPNRFGLGVNLGEPVGTAGISLAWNTSKHWQIQFSHGRWFDTEDRTKKAWLANQLLIRHYWRQLYIDMGVVHRNARMLLHYDPQTLSENRHRWGMPFHIGFEYGNRTGFYLGVSIGVEWIPWEDGDIQIGDERMGVYGTFPTFGIHFGSYVF